MLQNSNVAATPPPPPGSAAVAAAAAAANNAAIAASSIQPKLVVIRRRPNQGFGFTLRHFIAYPPEDDAASWPQEATNAGGSSTSGSSSSGGGGGGGVVVVGGGGSGALVGLEPTSPTSLPPYQVKAMETIFIKEVQVNGPAHYANLQTGDRVLMVNNTPIAGIAYSTIVSMIKQTPAVLTLHVVPKECDVLQMHYTSIAHTPESNRLTMSATPPASAAAAAAGSSTLTNGAAAGNKSQFLQQQLISYPAVVASSSSSSSNAAAASVSPHHAPALHGGSRSGSITSQASSSSQQRHPAISSGGSLDFGDISHGLRQHHQQQQQQLYQQQQLLSGAFMRANQPPNLTVLASTSTRQPKSAAAALGQALYAANASGGGAAAAAGGGAGGDNSDLMIRLRESIKQKEEFLKSPLPAGAAAAAAALAANGNQSSPQSAQSTQQQQQHFFPTHMPVVPPRSSNVRQQVLHKQQQQQQQQQQLVLGFDMYNCYAGSKLVQRAAAPQQQQQQQQLQSRSLPNNNAKYPKELDYFETLQETGVTNKVFERKLVTHMSKGFDPFKPLSINTEAASGSGGGGGNNNSKKSSVLYESLQQHPLHQMHSKYQQHSSHQQSNIVAASTSSSTSSSMVDGQTSSRMELHKATLANATLDSSSSTHSKYSSVMLEHHAQPAASSAHTVASLADIAESRAAAIVEASAVVSSVVRRFKPLASSSFDEGKPMRRISYLRATNNENNEYAAESTVVSAESAGAGHAAAAVVTAATAAAAAAVVEPHKTKALVEEHPDPTYDVIAGGAVGHEFIETPNGLEDVRLSALHGSRRASMSSEMRSSIHIDAELNGKYVPNELEAFETEIEIKSSCINGKRMSEYRSWRQVKLEIKGDLLRIYSGRHGKSEHNVIELDIRNFKFFDESLDKKKFLIRMQSKPSTSNAHLATLGNELNLDAYDAHDKLTSSGSSSAAEPQTPAAPSTSCGPYTEILFKTKSSNEMKRLFGLLQWKDSLNYDDEQPAGRQLAEPQKTAATASYLDDVVGGAADSSPLSSHSGGQLEGATVSTIAAAAAGNSDSISPVMKLRKPSGHKHVPDKDLGSPKSKNWKDLLFRRGGSGGSAGVSSSDLASPSSCAGKSIGSIGVPLRACPMSKLNAYVPHLVEVCTNIVETKGLSVVGIYRIPGNKAAISELSELVNTKDFQFDSCATDVRWEDVNVVSSLLKLFIRSLPDALMPASFYINFIEADKKTGLERIVLLKEIVESLPRHPYETMKHLIRHLCRVSDNCEVNRMEPKNLAIIFGPSIIRTPNDTLETAVKDMKHQCRIVELLVTQYEYFFENGSLPEVADLSGAAAAAASPAQPQQTQEDQTSMLLHNLSKIERITERETRTSRFIPQLRRRTHGKRSAVSSDTYSGESVLSLDYAKVSASSTSSSSTLHSSSKNSSSNSQTTKQLSSSTVAVASTSSSSTSKSSSSTTTTTTKKRSSAAGFLSGANSRSAQARKASLDEKDSGSMDSSSGLGKQPQQQPQRCSVDISILLTDDDSSSRLSDTGSMSLTTITDTLDSKLRNLRSGSESNDENGSPEFPKNRRHTLGQPLHLHSENIPYADESPERLFHNFCPLDAPHALHLSRSCTATNSLGDTKDDTKERQQLKLKPTLAPLPASLLKAAHKLQHSATAPIHQGSSTAPTSGAATPTAGTGSSSASTPTAQGGSSSATQRNSYGSRNLRFSSLLAYERGAAAAAAAAAGEDADDSEGSTTSDPKEKLLLSTPAPSFFHERYNKKRRDHRLFRSASFNCRNYTTRHLSTNCSSATAAAAAAAAANASCCSPSSHCAAAAGLTKDEKTDMNLTKKRQIQNKQNRSIKRRHTVGGPHDYAANASVCAAAAAAAVAAGVDLASINYNHHNRHHQQQLLKLGGAAAAAAGNGAAAAETTTTTTTTTTVLRRLGAGSAAVNAAGGSNSASEVNVALPTVANTSSSSSSSSSSAASNNNNSPLSEGSNGNNATGVGSSSSTHSSSSSVAAANNAAGGGGGLAAGDPLLEVGIRIKNRARY